MEDKLFWAVIGALISAILALVSTVLNYSSNKRLKELSKNYDILKLDLDKLKSMRKEIGGFKLPLIPSSQEIKSSNGDALIPVFSQLNPIYKEAQMVLLNEIERFPLTIQEEIKYRINDVGDKISSHSIAKQYDFILWATKMLNKEIERLRANWKK